MDATEVVLAYVSGVCFGEPSEKGADSGVECDDACLGLAGAPFGLEGYCEVVLAVMQCQPAVPVVRRQGLCHVHLSQDPWVGSFLCDGAPGDVASLLWVLAGTEADLGVGFLGPDAVGLCLGQFHVCLLAAGYGAAGVAYSDAFYLVGGCPEPFRCGVDDVGLDILPVGHGA